MDGDIMKINQNNKGFTLAEMLIVIAIIAALVAIMLPTFSGQIERAREATDIANVRAACSEVALGHLDEGKSIERTVGITQTRTKWQSANNDGEVELDNYIVAGTIKIKADPVGEEYAYKIYWSDSENTIKVEIVTKPSD